MKLLTAVVIASLLICLEVQYATAAELSAAVTSIDVTPPIGTPLGGYGGGGRRLAFPFDLFNKYKYATLFKPSEGVRDPLRAKVMLLRANNKKLAFVSIDTVGITEEAYKEITKRLAPFGYHPDDIFVSATHTHSGPGTLSNNFIWQVAIMDIFQKDILEIVLGGVVSAVLQAATALQPAQLLSYSFVADGIQVNRRGKIGHFDPQANVMVVRADSGEWLGGMTNLPVHGTAFSPKNLHFSADVPGSIERQMEYRFGMMNQSAGFSKPVTFLFVNGAEGDVAPKYGESDGVDLLGAEFADQAIRALGDARNIEPVWSVHSLRIDLGEPAMNLTMCGAKIPLVKAFKLGLGTGLFGPGLPNAPRFSLIRLGDMALISWPGEPTTTLGLALKTAYSADPHTKQVWTMGLTNGYVAYFTTPEEYFEGSYESCSTLYGPAGGNRVVDEFKALSNMSYIK